MAKNEKDKQTTAQMTQHRKLKNKQHKPHQKTQVIQKGKQIMLHTWHTSCCLCDNKSINYKVVNDHTVNRIVR